MQVTRSEIGSVAVLALSGPFVEGEEGALMERIDACTADSVTRIVVDMKHVPFIDSAGLETLHELVPELAKKGADFRITGLNDVCRDIFVSTRIMNLLHVVEDTEHAVRSDQ